MTDEPRADEHDRDDRTDESPDGALVSRLRVIEDQPLGDRAAAYGQVHDELRSRLESSDSPRREH
jgi:hypothetical protein